MKCLFFGITVLLSGAILFADSSQNTDQQYLKQQSSIAQYQIAAGQLADTRSQNPQIKGYAQQAVKEAQRQERKIEQAQQQSGQQAQSPDQQSGQQGKSMGRVEKAMLEELLQCNENDFDRQYTFNQAAIQRIQALQSQWEQKSGQSEQVKELARATETAESQGSLSQIVAIFVSSGTAGQPQQQK